MKAPPPARWLGYPVVTPARMREIDRRASAEFGISALELMENAGQAVAAETARLMRKGGESLSGRGVVVCCGRGNNGGDGLAAARHLKGMGARAWAFIVPLKRDGAYPPETAENLARARAAGIEVAEFGDDFSAFEARLAEADAVVDALLGTGSSGKPAGHVHKAIQGMNRAGKPVVAVDIPSGLHPETGYHSGVVATAALTCALGLPKTGLLAPAAKRFVGELKVLDIGFPKQLLEEGP